MPSTRQQPDLGAVRTARCTTFLRRRYAVRRMRAGIWLLVAALLLFGVEVVAVLRCARETPPLPAAKVVQLLSTGVGLLALVCRAARRRGSAF